MVEFTNECVDCPKEMGCLGSSCPYMHVPHLICDKCGEEVEELYYLDGDQLCEYCVLKSLDKVDPSDECDCGFDEPDEDEYLLEEEYLADLAESQIG